MPLQELFNMWLDGVKIIISGIPFLIGLILITILIYVSFDLLTFTIFGDMMFAKTFLPEKIYKRICDYLNKEW